jgi:hypothetical protein
MDKRTPAWKIHPVSFRECIGAKIRQDKRTELFGKERLGTKKRVLRSVPFKLKALA